MKAKDLGLAAGGAGILALILHAILNKRNRPGAFQGLPDSAGPALLARASQMAQTAPAASEGSSAPSWFRPRRKPVGTGPFTSLTPEEESRFKQDYADYSKRMGLDADPNNPLHYYDYRGAWKGEGGLHPDTAGHLPSKYKLPGHPREVIDGVNTRTGKPVKNPAAQVKPFSNCEKGH